MGQDIHLYLEYKFINASWHATSTEEIFVWRDYTVFNTLVATARGDVEVSIVDEPRGLPYDVSTEAQKGLSDPDYHSHSYITWEEFTRFFPFTRPGDMSHFALIGWQLAAGAYRLTTQRRLVFAFDT